MDREAVPGQAVAAVVVELRRHEVELQVRPFVPGQRAAQEAARLGDVRRSGPRARQQVAQGDAQLAEPAEVVSIGTQAAKERADVEVVLQVRADARQVRHHRDAEGGRARRRADPRQQQ
jgi:hypothetical protein